MFFRYIARLSRNQNSTALLPLDQRPVISTEGRDLFILPELQTHWISPFGRDDRTLVEMTRESLK
uniref:Uncharacterized protein n=1 Tax=Candidatus Kentrum sp. SD TaxID=2126332 RepID=A0A450YJ73_9GAMM|nr:MAG: hypothetical protein BECKSD772F_GA0070984_109510 [Candidatus Kentron sp. SD]VFK47634.1 MAG: hypothetical protein BECKSD772E_GA0070983_110010 [Candidatus Kentron sp. SD]